MSETADSGRVTDDEVDKVAALAMDRVAAKHGLHALEINPDVTAHHTLRRELVRAGYALAAQGRGEAVAWMAEDDAALSARTSGRMGGINDGTRFISFKELKQGDYRHVFPLYTAPPASPAGVPDGWADVYAAFKGAFDTPAAWLKDNSEYANDARKRLREFNEAMLAAAQSAPEGGEVGL